MKETASVETTPVTTTCADQRARWALFLDFDMVLNDQTWLMRERDHATTLATNTLAAWSSLLDPSKLSILGSFLTAHPFI